MVDILSIFGVHTIHINRMRLTPYGMKPASSVEVPGCWVVEETRLVRDKTGAEVVSTARVAAPIGTVVDLDTEPTVTLPSGRTARVISVQTADPGPLPMPRAVYLNLE